MVNSVFFDLVTDTEIKEIIDGLRCGIASGYDEIPHVACKRLKRTYF
jgi:hypothetical protein